jgi:16S rRNA (cytosine967-C5)-methyltransferase
MSRNHSYLFSASRIIEAYKPWTPLHLHLRNFFAAEKKYGSKDRKIIADLCYCFFRTYSLNHPEADLTNRLLTGAFICGKESASVANSLKPEWSHLIHLNPIEKIRAIGCNENSLFTYADLVSSSLNIDTINHSLLKQPNLFIRIRPGKLDKVNSKLKASEIEFIKLGDSAFQFASGTKLDVLLNVGKEVIVQDLSSQQVFDKLINWLPKKEMIEVWDVCAASGGKSILIHDLLDGNIKLTVSDIRENILQNLSYRLKDAGVTFEHKFACDVSGGVPLSNRNKFDLIICDVPCTGSGTWSRTPEQQFSFQLKGLTDLTGTQKSIVGIASKYLQENGILIYITCSVFAAENEENVQEIAKENSLAVVDEYYINGSDMGADTMFVAIMKR